MEWVYHINVIEIDRCRLISNVNRVLKRKIPYRECLKLSVSSLDASLMVVIKLRKTGRHLSASRSGSRNDNERVSGFNIFVLTVSVFANYILNVCRISLYRIMLINFNTKVFKSIDKFISCRLLGILSDNNTANADAYLIKSIDKPERVKIIRNTEVASYLILRD